MARRKPQTLRPSYASDAQYLVRLAHAVEEDTRQTPRWRGEVSALLQEVAGKFAVANLRGRIAPGNTEGA